MDLFTRLMDAGADGRAGWRGYRGRTLLGAAAYGKNEEMVQRLLKAGATEDVNVRFGDRFELALHVAAGRDAQHVSGTLLIAGADPNLLDGIGRSPLHVAAEEGHHRVLRLLLLKGAELNNNKTSDLNKLVLNTPLFLLPRTVTRVAYLNFCLVGQTRIVAIAMKKYAALRSCNMEPPRGSQATTVGCRSQPRHSSQRHDGSVCPRPRCAQWQRGCGENPTGKRCRRQCQEQRGLGDCSALCRPGFPATPRQWRHYPCIARSRGEYRCNDERVCLDTASP
ncbi:unnamed protein product [Ectocarpus sp. 12 AP-2014]